MRVCWGVRVARVFIRTTKAFNMTVEKITETVRVFLSQFISETNIDEDQDLFESGLLNSLFAMQLVIFLEKEYEFQIGNEDLNISNFKSLNAITTFVMKKKS